MPSDQLRTDVAPASRSRLLGSTWNRLAGMVNAPINGYPVLPGTTGPGMAGINVGGGMTMMPSQMTEVGCAIVTSAEDTCPEDTTEDDGFYAPCRSSKKYLAKFRRWSSGSGIWVTANEDEYPVDLAMWWPDETTALTSGPILLVDDIFPVWLDPMRGMLVPLWFPTVRPVILTTALSVGATATAAVIKKKAGAVAAPWWESVTGVTLTVYDLSLNTADPEWDIGTKGLAIWMTNLWLFVPLGCEPDDTGIV